VKGKARVTDAPGSEVWVPFGGGLYHKCRASCWRTLCGIKVTPSWKRHKLAAARQLGFKPCLRCFTEERQEGGEWQ
jgi:hypothetical protein